jgi:hypothetical protein
MRERGYGEGRYSEGDESAFSGQGQGAIDLNLYIGHRRKNLRFALVRSKPNPFG